MISRLVLIAAILIANSAAANKVLVRDRALFRVEREVFFKEAFLIWAKEWQGLQCASRRSLVMRALDLEGQDFRGIGDLLNALENRSATSIERQSIERLVRLVKFMLYVQSQPTNKNEKEWPRSLRCVKDNSKITQNLELFGRAENFLRERFRTEEDAERKRTSNDDMIRAKAFIDSVLRGQSHEIFL